MSLVEIIREKLKQKKILLMTHVVVGYPSLKDNWVMLQAMAEVGVDLVELQMPFSEPIADGPIFVRANQEAISNGITLNDYFSLMKKTCTELPMDVLMMGYCNTAFKMGFDLFPQFLRDHGAKGFILPDLPVEEYGNLFRISREQDIDPIMLCTPTNTLERLSQIFKKASGFVYCVARKGVTGEKTRLDKMVENFLKHCRDLTDLPLALGFGISKTDDLEMLKGQADIAIVGSALLKSWEEGGKSVYRDHLFSLAEARN